MQEEKFDYWPLTIPTIFDVIRVTHIELYWICLLSQFKNLSEKGQFESLASAPAPTTRPDSQTGQRPGSLPLRHKHSSGGSRHSSMSEGRNSPKPSPQPHSAKSEKRDPEATFVQFNFKFEGFEAQLFTGNTPLNEEEVSPCDCQNLTHSFL